MRQNETELWMLDSVARPSGTTGWTTACKRAMQASLLLPGQFWTCSSIFETYRRQLTMMNEERAGCLNAYGTRSP